MAQEKEEILIEIVVSNEAATKAIFENQQNIDRLKQSQIELNKARKDGSITDEEYSKKSTAIKVAIDAQKESIRQNEKELRNNIKTQNDNSDSLAAMRAQLSNNIKAFDNMSKAERDSAKGQELKNSITNLVEELKIAEEETGRFQRNVGNYPGLTKGASEGITHMTGFLGKMSAQVEVVSPKIAGMLNQISGFAAKSASAASEIGIMNQTMNQTGQAAGAVEGFAGKASGSLNNLANTSKVAGAASSGAFNSIASGAKALGTVFLTPPIIIIAAVIGTIVAAFKLLQRGFELNDAASEKMEGAFATLQPILDAVGKLATTFAEAVAGLVGFLAEAAAGAIDFAASLFGVEAGFSKAAEEARNLKKAQNELEDAERQFTVNSAERQLQRAKLLAEVADKEKNNAEKRIAYLKDAGEIDKQELEEKKRIAIQNYLLTVQQAKNESDTSDETADKIAAARVRALNANTEYFEGVKEINKKLSAAEAELEAEQKANYEKWKKRKDDQIAKETQLVRQLEDLVINQIKDDYLRQIEAEKAKTARANEDLRKRLLTEENLTKEAKDAINKIILLNDQNLIDKQAELIEKSYDASIKKELEAKQRSIEAQLQLAEQGSIDELNIKLARLAIAKDQELQNAELTNIERLAVEEKYNRQAEALNDGYLADRYDRISEALEKELKINQLRLDDHQASLQLRYDYDLAAHERLLNLDEKEKAALFKSKEDYEIAVLESNKRIEESNAALKNQQISNANAVSGAYAGVTNEIINLTNQQIDQELAAHDRYLESRKSQLDREIDMINNKNITDEEKAKQIHELKKRYNEEDKEITNQQNERVRRQQSFAKALALSTLAIKTAVAVAGAIASAQDMPYPYNLVAAGTAIAAVLAFFGQAREILAADKQVEMPQYATGGLVRGSGTGTSDSIQARVSNGESIINANSTSMFSPLLSALNQAGGGVGFGSQDISNQLQGEEMLARAFAKGVAMLPNPVVSVKEINEVNDRLTILKEL